LHKVQRIMRGFQPFADSVESDPMHISDGSVCEDHVLSPHRPSILSTCQHLKNSRRIRVCTTQNLTSVPEREYQIGPRLKFCIHNGFEKLDKYRRILALNSVHAEDDRLMEAQHVGVQCSLFCISSLPGSSSFPGNLCIHETCLRRGQFGTHVQARKLDFE
jgi:hypothetical protein